jgi:hypothetical protein
MILLDIIKGIASFFSGSSESNWDLYRFKTVILQARQHKIFPYLATLPEVIYLNNEFWKQVRSMYQLTLKDKHEREIAIYYLDQELIFTKEIRGEKSRVLAQHRVTVRYVPQKGSEYLTKEVRVDGEVYSANSVYYQNVPKKIDLAYLFNIHTHPPHYYNQSEQLEDRYYGFFSLTDIRSLLKSNVAVTGMISDKCWLLIRTKESPASIHETFKERITPEILVDQFKFGVYSSDLATAKLIRYR